MALYRLKPGFVPETASFPPWNFDGRMDYLLGSVFEVKEELYLDDCLTTVDADGNTWYLNPDWVVPAVIALDLTVLGDKI